MYEQYQEVVYQGNKAIVELVLGRVDQYDYLLKLCNGIYIPVSESDIQPC